MTKAKKRKKKQIKDGDYIEQWEFCHRFKQSPFYRLAADIGLKLGIKDIQRSEGEMSKLVFTIPDEPIEEMANEWTDYENALRKATKLYEEFLPEKKPPTGPHPTPEIGLAEIRKWCIESYADLLDKENEHLVPLSDAEQEVWDLLKGRMLSSKQIARKFDRSPEAIRQRIAKINQTRRKIVSKGVSGYYRPDAPLKS